MDANEQLMAEAPPIACNLCAFDTTQQARYSELLMAWKASVQETRETDDGYTFLLPADSETCLRAVEWVTLERRCCPFLTFRLELAAGSATLALSLSGPEGAKEVIREFLITDD